MLQDCTTLDHHPSDHLPISANLDFISLLQIRSTTPPKINWKKATLDSSIITYQQHVSTELSHLPIHQCDSSLAERSEHLDQDFRSGATAILKAAQHTLPVFKTQRCKKGYIDDPSLCIKCSMIKAAWSVQKNNGCPRSDPMYVEMLQQKRDVKSYVHSCRAQEERVWLQDHGRVHAKT